MFRLYIRLIFTRIKKFLYLFKNYKKLHHNFIKPAIYRKKILKVLESNKTNLAQKLEIIEITNQGPTLKSINFVR